MVSYSVQEVRHDQWEEIDIRTIGPCCLHVRLIHELEMWFREGKIAVRGSPPKGGSTIMDVTHRGEETGLIDESFLDFQGLRS